MPNDNGTWGKSTVNHVRYGKLRPDGRVQYTRVEPTIMMKCLVRRVAILATALILHPLGMAAADMLFTGKATCHQEVRTVLEKWMSKKKVEVIIDITGLTPVSFGFTKPFRGESDNDKLQQTVFLSQWHTDRL